MAGRRTLAKLVIEAFMMYSMMSSRIPRETLKEIERTQMKFIWGEVDDNKHLHTIRWSKLVKVKKE